MRYAQPLLPLETRWRKVEGMNMQYSKTGLHLTEQFESCKLTAYQDGKGVWTIGWGHTRNVFEGLTCTDKEAEAFLTEDVAYAVYAVNRYVKVTLNQEEFDALVDFVFNVGIGAFKNSQLLKLVNLWQFDDAAHEFLKWDHLHGAVCAGLLRRRQAEMFEFQSGVQGAD